MATIELISLDRDDWERATEDPEAFAGEHELTLGADPDLLRAIARQTLALIRRTGVTRPPWSGYLAVDEARKTIVGTCGFKSPPDQEGIIEIAYFTFPGFEGQGYATAMAAGLVQRGSAAAGVRRLRAHTLPEKNASTRILQKLGFESLGDIVDPEDGRNLALGTSASVKEASLARRCSMRTKRLWVLSMTTLLSMTLLLTMPVIGQERGGGQRGGGPPAGPAMTMTIPGFPDGGQIPVKFSQAAEGAAPGEGTSPAISWANPRQGRSRSCSTCTTWMWPATGQRTIRRTGWCGTFRRRPPACPKVFPRARSSPDGSYQISATGPVYRGPGAAATGPMHHYMFELFALDTKLDVQPTADAFETRANVLKAMQGHILGKAVYGGLFRRPQ